MTSSFMTASPSSACRRPKGTSRARGRASLLGLPLRLLQLLFARVHGRVVELGCRSPVHIQFARALRGVPFPVGEDAVYVSARRVGIGVVLEIDPGRLPGCRRLALQLLQLGLMRFAVEKPFRRIGQVLALSLQV